MSKLPQHRMGSAGWKEHVFTMGPARDNKGQSKHTQYHQTYIPSLNAMMGVQGRGEACALLLLLYFQQLGLIKRFKSQPFITAVQEFGSEICPDFLVELPDQRLLVLEIKTERFVTYALKQLFDSNSRRFESFGMTYLVWTDLNPLTHAVRHHALQMRRSAGDEIPREEIDGLTNMVSSRRTVSFREVFEAGFDLSCLYAAVWEGRVFIPLTKNLERETLITSWREENFEALFLDCKRSSYEWWDSL